MSSTTNNVNTNNSEFINIDLEQFQTLGHQLPEGTYRALIHSARTMKSSDREYIQVIFELNEPDYPDRHLPYRVYLDNRYSDLHLGRLFSAANVSLGNGRVRLDDLVDKEVKIRVKHNEKDGVVYENVARIMRTDCQNLDDSSNS